MNRIHFSSQSVHWATPQAFYVALDEEFHFDLDPCPLGSLEMNVSWLGRRVYCNPPYNRAIGGFLARSTEAEIAVFLLPARTDVKWFHDFCLPNAQEIRFIRGRLKFGGAKKDAPFPSMVVVFKK